MQTHINFNIIESTLYLQIVQQLVICISIEISIGDSDNPEHVSLSVITSWPFQLTIFRCI